jgi:hypothetical protein
MAEICQIQVEHVWEEEEALRQISLCNYEFFLDSLAFSEGQILMQEPWDEKADECFKRFGVNDVF